MSELKRCVAFLRELDRRAARRKVAFRFGTAYLNDELPRVWSRNYLSAEKDLGEASAALLTAEADRLLGGAGIAHRKIEVYDGEAGARFADGFGELGWRAECDAVMVARGEVDRESPAEEVSWEDLVPIWAEAGRSDSDIEDEEVLRQLAEGKRVVMSAIDTRFFGGRADGRIASYCELYSDGATAQIENVLTLEQYRNRGLGRALILRAVAESRAAGNDLTFLLASRDDWPKELYRKLGFEEVGHIWDFIRPASR